MEHEVSNFLLIPWMPLSVFSTRKTNSQSHEYSEHAHDRAQHEDKLNQKNGITHGW